MPALNILDAFQITQGLRPMAIVEKHDTKRPFLGVDYDVRVFYTFHKGYPSGEIDPGADDSVEIINILKKEGTDWIQVKADEIHTEEFELEILEKYL